MKFNYYEKHINMKTKGRYDITPLFQNTEVFQNLIKDLFKPFTDKKITKITAIDALGFVIGGAMAEKYSLSLVLIRKTGKLPGIKNTLFKSEFSDYSGKKKGFEIKASSISAGDRVLLVDDWIETGAQVKAAVKLIEKTGAKIAGITVLYCEKNRKTNILFSKYNINAINEPLKGYQGP